MTAQANNNASRDARIKYVMNRGLYTIPFLMQDPDKAEKLQALLTAQCSKENQAASDAFLDREYAMWLSGHKSTEDYLMSQALFAIPVIMQDPDKAEKLLAMQTAPYSEENQAAIQAFLDLEYAMMLSRH